MRRMVQEPALTLITGGGGTVIANMMNIEEANRYLGGPTSLWASPCASRNVRNAATRWAWLARARQGIAGYPHDSSKGSCRGVASRSCITGANRDRLAGILERYRQSSIPTTSRSIPPRVNRVAEAHKTAGSVGFFRRLQTLCSISPSLRSKCFAFQISPWVTVKNPSSKELALEVSGGKFVSLVGPSGSGKTSILRAITGLLTPRAGHVELNGSQESLGFLFQDDALLPWRSARENVALGLRIRKASKRRGTHSSRHLVEATRA